MQPSSLKTRGFTLIELVLVVAVLAIIATIAVGKFADLRKQAAKKAALASLVNIQRTLNTEIARADSVKNMFDYVESLIDVSPSGSWTGTEGEYDWDKNTVGAIPGIYRGIKQVGVVYNAGGVTTGTISTLEEARRSNTGITDDLADMCGIYYLTEREAEALENVGVSRVLLHNYTNGQSHNQNGLIKESDFASENGLPFLNGGPGHRPDMSAFYPSVLTNGSPVVVLNPAETKDIYRSLGVDYDITEDLSDSLSNPEDYFLKGICPRLVLFGLGRSSTPTAKYFEAPPRYEALDKTEYRNYILVFSLLTGTGNRGVRASFVGVITPEGSAAKGQMYNMDWSSN